MINICFYMRIASRQAMRIPGEHIAHQLYPARVDQNYPEPWVWRPSTQIIPPRDSWVMVSGAVWQGSPLAVKARVGDARYELGRQARVTIPLLLNTLQPTCAAAIGIRHEAWMYDGSPPASDARRWADLSDEDRDAFQDWRKADRDV